MMFAVKKFLYFILLSAAVCCSAAGKETYEIRTIDGQLYSPASVEHISPVGIDISYTGADGGLKMKRIPFDKLPEALQQEFGYDPAKARAFEAKLRRYQQKSEPVLPVKPVEIPREDAPPEISAPDRLREIGRELKSALEGGQSSLPENSDLICVFYAARRAVTLVAAERTKSGTAVRIKRDESGRSKLPSLILLSGITLAKEQKWTGFIYPTGLRANIPGCKEMPVFCDTAEKSALLVGQYLELHSGTSKENSSGIAGIDNKGKYLGPAGDYGVAGSGYWKWPFLPQVRPQPIRPRPHRPRPHRPASR